MVDQEGADMALTGKSALSALSSDLDSLADPLRTFVADVESGVQAVPGDSPVRGGPVAECVRRAVAEIEAAQEHVDRVLGHADREFLVQRSAMPGAFVKDSSDSSYPA